MDVEQTLAWQTLPAGQDLNQLIAIRAGWRLVHQDCAGGRTCKAYMFVLYDPNGQWANDTFIHVTELDADAVQLLWQNTPETHFSTDLKAAWGLLLQSSMDDVCISTNVIEADQQANHVVEATLADSVSAPDGQVEDYFYEGQAPLDQPALAVVRAWLAWHDARSAYEPIPA